MANNITDVKIKMKVSGVLSGIQTRQEIYPYLERDGQINVRFIYMGGSANSYNLPTTKTNYEDLLTSVKDSNTFLMNFENDSDYALSADTGLAPYLQDAAGNTYSIYKREYNKYSKPKYSATSHSYIIETKEYAGNWIPVASNISVATFRDFNVESGKSYQYIIYPSDIPEDNIPRQQFANKNIEVTEETRYGDPVATQWSEWSIAELIPETTDPYTPVIKKSYRVNIDNIWMFKYSLETGSQTQNINRNETQTLGQFLKIGYGNANYISGEVTALLGSEIVPLSNEGYVERMRGAIKQPLSTNEKALMLAKWRSFVSSKNPKLLKDIKGQSWIVQIMSGSNSPRNFYHNQPDTITFSWKQIDSSENVTIYGSGENLPALGECMSIWDPQFKSK